MRAEGCTRTAGRVRTYGAAGVSSSGHASKGILQEPKRASHLLRGGTGHQGRPEVRERQAAQQAFARQLIASQEAERKRIAAELHDGLGQHLVVIRNLALLT